MKRWQTRGEVQDSDEEELGLDSETEGLEQPRKKAKVDGLEDGGSWVEDKAVETSRPNTARDNGEPESTAQATGVTETAQPLDPKPSGTPRDAATQHDDVEDEPDWTVRKSTKTYGKLQRISRPDIGKARELFPVITQAEQHVVDASDLVTTYDPPSSSVLPEDPVAPVGEDEGSQDIQPTGSTTPTNDYPVADDTISRASSPLSELSDPPDSPLAPVHMSASSIALPRVEPGVVTTPNPVEQMMELDGHVLLPGLLTQGARRSLRARQEKQLHPYMYDKAQYQRQCRERGLRPVRLMEQTAQETQDASLDNAQPSSSATRPSSSSSSVGNPLSSGIAFEDLVRGDDPQRSFGDDDLPDMDRLLQNRANTGRLKSRKRRKLAHKPIDKNSNIEHPGFHHTMRDGFSVPPSPPTSSRGSEPRTAKAPQVFRLPRGMSPIPLPTPQISSDMRPSHGINNKAASDEDTPPRTLRRMTRVRSAVTIGSDSSSESEQSSSDNERQLQQERRRIRGVLPASWLHIDRKAQPTAKPVVPAHVDRDSPDAAPQKGVARKIQRRSTCALGAHVLEISDDDEAAGSGNPTPTTTQHRPLTHEDHTEAPITQRGDEDSDEMEVDWFDPMLAAASRSRGPSDRTDKRQPRITDVLNKRPTPDFSEERNGLRQMRKTKAANSKRLGGQTKSKSKSKPRPQRKAPQLGILDAPMDQTDAGNRQPQFVRLAARQARRGADQGRHSPSHKVIRLSTLEDSEHANATLESWKRGAIAQKSYVGRPASNTIEGNPEIRPAKYPRTPLTDTINHSVDAAPHSKPPRLDLNKSRAGRFTGMTSRATNHRPMTQQLAQSRPEEADTGPRRRLNKAAPTAARYRGAQLETQESAYMQQNRSAAFQRRIQCLTETVARRSTTPASGGLQMSRFLQETTPAAAQEGHDLQFEHYQEESHAREPIGVVSENVRPIPHRPRKRRTQRLDVDTRQYRQPSEPLPIVDTAQDLTGPSIAGSDVILQGLGPSGTRYAIDFDISRLPTSTYFHESTFIGSGDLNSALQLGKRSMQACSGSLRIYINGTKHEWSAWSEEVSSAMGEMPAVISNALSALSNALPLPRHDDVSATAANIEHMLRSTIRYLSKCIYFLDAVDSKACCLQLDQISQDLMEITEDGVRWDASFQDLRQSILQGALVIARQSQAIAEATFVPMDLRTKLRDRTLRVAYRLASCVVPGKLISLRSAYEEQRMMSVRELGIRDNTSALAGTVILHQCLRDFDRSRSTFWEVIGKALGLESSILHASAEIDATWYAVFTILPCLDFNSAGIIQRRSNALPEMDWSLPVHLVQRCLELYPATSTVRGSSVNEYIRTILKRCCHLFNYWHWWRCETMLNTVYDFFTRRGLSLLYHEEGKGSPDFLENLTCPDGPSLEVRPDDCSFPVFLKLLAASMQTWRKQSLLPDKKIGGIAWRMLPNHARIYRKDVEVRQADLDALRNHFDLLCTLYFASPPSHRLRIDLLRNLVDHATSHREACRISVRAWSRLASFQMSTDEDTKNLEPFIEWYQDMMQTTVAQYRSARIEAEQQYAAAKESGASGLSEEVLETTIASNQRQIAATIVDLLAAYRRALESAHNIHSARLLIERGEPWKAFDSFALSERRLKTVYNEALDLFRATIEVQRRFQTGSDSQTVSEDSQDYGDIDILHEFATGQAANQSSDSMDLVALMQHALARSLSDAFGSDVSPDDVLLERLLDVWVQYAKHLVSKGLRSWSNFVSDYTTGSWTHLRATTQHRKFTPYILAKILEADTGAFDTLRSELLGAWLQCIVERESALKYQHLLTASLLNVCSEEPVLQNLPFSKISSEAKYEVTMQEFRQRRLGLISSILSNMLEHYNQTMLDRPQSLPKLGRRYSELFRCLMQAMKSNYQDLQLTHGNGTTGGNVQGSYVVFVQEVVTFLQQYAIEGVCAIDRFFLDDNAFPLPADDPQYVVGRLRKHVPKLTEAKTRKQLATFLHSISERAAIDGKQAYLIDQMHKAMSGTMETGDMNAPSLRHVLLTSVIPAYIETAVGNQCAWVLVVPMIEASARTVADLLYDTDLSNEDSLAATLDQLATLLDAVQKSLSKMPIQPETLRMPHALKTGSSLFKICDAAVVFANHVQRSTGQAAIVMRQLRNAQTVASQIEEIIITPDDFFDPVIEDLEYTSPLPTWSDTYAFSMRQIQGSMATDWSVIDGRYFVKRGNSSKEVMAELGEYSQERDGLLEQIEAFRSALRTQRLRGRSARNKGGHNDDAFGLGALVI